MPDFKTPAHSVTSCFTAGLVFIVDVLNDLDDIPAALSSLLCHAAGGDAGRTSGYRWLWRAGGVERIHSIAHDVGPVQRFGRWMPLTPVFVSRSASGGYPYAETSRMPSRCNSSPWRGVFDDFFGYSRMRAA